MWILRNAQASPFGRKVRIAAEVCRLADRIETRVADTTDPADSLRVENPLGKIPALILEDGTVLFDSRVIVEFFDGEAGGGFIIPPRGEGRFRVLALQALADGIMDASLLRVYETRYREPAMHNQRWLDSQKGKVERGLTRLESAPPAIGIIPDIGAIALACALGYQDLRFEGTWRKDYPRLVVWLDDFAAKVPSFAATRPT